MKKSIKNISMILAIALLLLLSWIWIYSSIVAHPDRVHKDVGIQISREHDAAVGLLTDIPGGSLARYMKERDLDTNEATLQQLDFSPPAKPPCHEEGALKVFRCDKKPWDGKPSPDYVAPELFATALEPNSKYYFTLGNRVEGQGTELPDLIVVAASPFKAVCSELNTGQEIINGSNIPKLPVAINLTPNTEPVLKEAIITLPRNRTCYEGPDGKFYFIATLIAR